VEKLAFAAGDKIVFDKVLLTANDDGSNAVVGAPYIAGVSVAAACVEQGRADKIRVVKYKRKVRYRRVQGHRQHQTTVKIA
jgi:large subunit ribosomal protein L21